MKKIIFSLLALIVLVPSVAYAELVGGSGSALYGGSGGKVELKNPIGADTFPELIKIILDAAFVIGLPVAVLFIVIAGFRFVWARGNSTKLQSAKTNLLYTIVGIGVFFGAWTLAKIIEITIKALGPGVS